MFRISTKGRYGFRLMLELSKKHGYGSVSLKEIAERINISEKYLWHLIRMLKDAGFVQSIRGANGGYMISRPTDQISLKDILTALEGPLEIEFRRNAGTFTRLHDHDDGGLWAEVSRKISDTLTSYTLKDMLQMQKKDRSVNDYSI